MQNYPAPLGAHYSAEATHFCVWAPNVQQVDLHLLRDDLDLPMTPLADGYYTLSVADLPPGDRYLYRLDGTKTRPDPASRSQPDGVHGPSQIVADTFAWTDGGFRPPSRRNSVMYELHVGTFTPEGTFQAIIPHLPYLHALGVTTLQLMPIIQFPGARNWGYDGVQLFAPHADYGGVDGLKRLVDACHAQGLAVMLDAVYNHLGPEGNYLWDYGPYFTDRYHSPWSDSVNFDGPHSDHVRRFFIENAIHWLDLYHIDGLRLDATHALFDFSARPFLEELSSQVHSWAERHDRQILLVAENDRSDYRLTLSPDANGQGLDAQWLDDFHHLLHVALTGESDGYYVDYQEFALLPKVLRESFAYSGQYSPARKRKHGTSARSIPSDRFIVATQTHDQVGNRMLGERLTQLTDFDGLKLAAALLATSPYIPMLFMGEEYGESAPFLFFVSHGDPALIEAVRQGRVAEFADFAWQGSPPDPQAESTFAQCKLDHTLREGGSHAQLLHLYQTLLALRRAHPALTNPDRNATLVHTLPTARILCLERHDGPDKLRIYLNFDLHAPQSMTLPGDEHAWQKLCASDDAAWQTEGAAPMPVPAEFSAHTAHAVTLPPKGFVLYAARHANLNETMRPAAPTQEETR
jgi:maltooligosyltrehalose trehalohydrolase